MMVQMCSLLVVPALMPVDARMKRKMTVRQEKAIRTVLRTIADIRRSRHSGYIYLYL